MKISSWGIAIGVIACSLINSEVHAFNLSDHTLITTQAVKEFNHCVSQGYSEEDLKVLDEFNLIEDLNFLSKWTKYSHYYRPFESLDFYWRSDSSARVADLGASSLSLEVIGGILHYLQDAASPLHVVPVSHGLTDGFENYSLSDLQMIHSPLSEVDCEILRQSVSDLDSPLELLSEVGVGTLRLLSELTIHAKSNENTKILVASNFWRETPLDKFRKVRPFGQYGDLGNSFGSSELEIEGTLYQVSEAEYDRVKVAYLRWGVEISKKLLTYAWRKSSGSDARR